MPRSPARRRAGLAALFLVAVLVTAAAIGLAATASLRSQATRQVAHLGAALDQIAVAEEALAEVTSQPALYALMQDPANRDAVIRSVAEGTRSGGYVATADVGALVAPQLTIAAATDRGFEVSPVKMRLMEYYPGTSRGRLRFTVHVGSLRDGGPGEAAYSQEFEVRVFEPGVAGELAFEITEQPEWRIYP